MFLHLLLPLTGGAIGERLEREVEGEKQNRTEKKHVPGTKDTPVYSRLMRIHHFVVSSNNCYAEYRIGYKGCIPADCVPESL